MWCRCRSRTRLCGSRAVGDIRVCVCVSAAYITATYSTPWQAIGNAWARRRHLRLTAFGRWSRRTLLGAGLTARTWRKKLVPRPRV